MKTRLLIDCNHLAIRTLFANSNNFNNPNPELQLHKHMFMNTLIGVIGSHKPREVVIAVDGQDNWRKLIYPEYKLNRKINRDNDPFPWGEYFQHFTELINDVKKYFPFKIITLPKVEADDIIAALVQNTPSDIRNIIVTSDKDYIQLLKHDRTTLFDPIKNIWVKVDDPKRELDIKILMGDKSDNIPAIKPRVGEKTAIKILDDPDMFDGILEEVIEVKNKEGEVIEKINVKDNYERNIKLIDMDRIPNSIIKAVLKKYETYQLPEHNTMTMTEYFITNKLRDLHSRLSQVLMVLKPLRGDYIDEDEEFFN